MVHGRPIELNYDSYVSEHVYPMSPGSMVILTLYSWGESKQTTNKQNSLGTFSK